MSHAHIMDGCRAPQYTVHPVSPLRAHFKDTHATFRGTHLLSTVQGGKLAVPSLCALHDFSNERAGTTRIL